MAKQHRMAVMTLGCLLGLVEFWFFDDSGFDPDGTAGLRVLHLAAWVIALGSILTCFTRIRAIAKQLEAR
jgi:hypothetical protein